MPLPILFDANGPVGFSPRGEPEFATCNDLLRQMDRYGKYGTGEEVFERVAAMARGLRVSGTSEFSGLDAPPDFRRARVLITKAKKLFPQLDPAGFTEWSGDRPVLPDTLPVIGRSPHHKNAIYAFGHSQVGLSLGGITGKLVADIVAGRPPSIDLTPYRVDRFERG
jgi:glycine/D-amino acid oxidase-like deaminating enzyme